jgi:hypothetical protein
MDELAIQIHECVPIRVNDLPIVPRADSPIHVLRRLREESVSFCIVVFAKVRIAAARSLTSFIPFVLLIFNFLYCPTSNTLEKKIELKEV